MRRIFKDKPFIIKWYLNRYHCNHSYINRFNTLQEALARIEELRVYGIVDVDWVKKNGVEM